MNLTTIIASSLYMSIGMVTGVFLQVQAWDINPTSVFGVLCAVLGYAVVTLWQRMKRMEEVFNKKISAKDEVISKLQDTRVEELKKLLKSSD